MALDRRINISGRRGNPANRKMSESLGRRAKTAYCVGEPADHAASQSPASSSVFWTGGYFMYAAQGGLMTPPSPRSRATLHQRTKSMTTPAEFGESQTSSFNS